MTDEVKPEDVPKPEEAEKPPADVAEQAKEGEAGAAEDAN
jgi:hypothetical protein